MKKILSFSSTNTPKFAFFVCTTKKESEQAELPLVQSLLKMDLGVGCGVSVDVFAEFENTQGLSQRYNEFIDYCKGNYSYLAFVHDDIWLNDVFFFDKVINSKFDVVGAVGGLFWGVPKGFPIDEKPLIWTMATCGRGASGFMNHDLKREDGLFLPSSYGAAPSQTLTLDGSIIIFTRKAIQAGLRWDEQFNFHFYDMDICCAAHRLGLKVGTANLLLTHESVGGSVVQPEFLESQKKFIEKNLKKV